MDAAHQIFNGTYVCPPGMDLVTTDFLYSLHIVEPDVMLNMIPMTVNKEENNRIFMDADLCTSVLPCTSLQPLPHR